MTLLLYSFQSPPTGQWPCNQLEKLLWQARADLSVPFNENDITYFISLYIQSVATLNCFPLHITADAAFDAWYAYQTCAFRDGIAAIPLNQHAHPVFVRDADGTPRCPMGLRMSPTYQFQHTNGYRAQRYRCPLLFPQPTGQSCDHEQFRKGKKPRHDLLDTSLSYPLD